MNASKEHPPMTAGLDLGDKYSYLSLIDSESGEVVEEGRLRSTPEALRRRFASEQTMRIAIEAGTHSPWASRVLEECGHEVLVANARKLRLIYANKQKTDQIDAENLARLARLDPKLLYPLQHRGENSQAHMALIRSRQALVGSRTQLVNHVRGAVKSFGHRLPKCPAASFHKRAAEHIPEALRGPRARPGDDRFAHRAHPGLRPKAGEDLIGALPRNRALAPGRGSRSAHGAHVRAYPGRSLPLRKEP
jgi:transposase